MSYRSKKYKYYSNVLTISQQGFINCIFNNFLDLEIFGLTMLEGLPSERDTVTKFAWEKFGYPQFTQYGDSFEVMNKPGPSNVAYTGKTLGLHLDQPIYTNRLERQRTFRYLYT